MSGRSLVLSRMKPVVSYSMNQKVIRILWTVLVIAVYFTGWKELRTTVTSSLVIPQLEAASAGCDTTIDFEAASNTAVVITRGANSGEMISYRFNAPAGFYLLFGTVLLILFGAEKRLYLMFLGYHLVFAIFSISTIYVGACSIPGFLHISAAGNSYFTPFFTFFVLLYLLFPSFRSSFNEENQ